MKGEASLRTMWTHFTQAALLGSLVVLAACSGPQLKLEPIPVTANPTVEADKLAAELDAARQRELDAFAPLWFGRAEDSLADARSGIQRRGQMATIFESLSRGRAELARAGQAAQITRAALPEAVKAREDARAAGAATRGQAYVDAETLFRRLARAVEEDNVNYAQRRQPESVEAFRALTARP
jgi:hypothetical protein